MKAEPGAQSLYETGFLEAGLAVALQHIEGPAFLATKELQVFASNDAGQRLLESDPAATRQKLLQATRNRVPAPGAVKKVRGRDGVEGWFIVLPRCEPRTTASRATLVARRAGLTAAQTRVLLALANGLTNRGIAEELRLSTRTVESHLFAIFDKLGVSTRAAVLATLLELH
jgi:DNA-binding NarL/FixJ family response regulator